MNLHSLNFEKIPTLLADAAYPLYLHCKQNELVCLHTMKTIIICIKLNHTENQHGHWAKELYCYEFNVDLTIIIYTSDISSTDTPHSLTKYSTTEVNPFKAAEWIGWNPPYNQLCLTDDTSQYTYYWYHFSFCSRIHIIFYN